MEERKRTTHIYPYKDCVEGLVEEQLPRNIASTLCSTTKTYGNYLSLGNIFERGAIKGRYIFHLLKDKEKYAIEIYEEFLKQDYRIQFNDGIDDEEIIRKFGDEEFFEYKSFLRDDELYQYKKDEKMLKECSDKKVPYYKMFFQIDALSELVSAELIKETEEVVIKKLFRTVVEKKTKLKLKIVQTDFLKRLIENVFSEEAGEDQKKWLADIKLDGLYVAFKVESKNNASEEDVIIRGHEDYRGAYKSVDDYYQYASKKANGCYVDDDNAERYLRRIDENPFEIKTNKQNPKITITDVVLVTK